jgi:hypothetical protein
MSDLQCPATFLIASGEMGTGRVHDLVEQVRGRRISAVYASLGLAAEPAKLAASELGLEPRLSDALGEPADFTQAIDEIADVHRGEAVLVFTNDHVMRLAVPGQTRHLVPHGTLLPVTEMDVDSDGWRLRSIPQPSPDGPDSPDSADSDALEQA